MAALIRSAPNQRSHRIAAAAQVSCVGAAARCGVRNGCGFSLLANSAYTTNSPAQFILSAAEGSACPPRRATTNPRLLRPPILADNLDNAQARYYSSPMARFMSPDPYNMGADPSNPQSWNMYSYVINNPLNAIDPSGMDCIYLNDAGSAFSTIQSGDCSSPDDNGYFVDGTVADWGYYGDTLEVAYCNYEAETCTSDSDEYHTIEIPLTSPSTCIENATQRICPTPGAGGGTSTGGHGSSGGGPRPSIGPGGPTKSDFCNQYAHAVALDSVFPGLDSARQEVYGPIVAAVATKAARSSAESALEDAGANSIRKFAISQLGKTAGRQTAAELTSVASKVLEGAAYLEAFLAFNDTVNTLQRAYQACMAY